MVAVELDVTVVVDVDVEVDVEVEVLARAVDSPLVFDELLVAAVAVLGAGVAAAVAAFGAVPFGGMPGLTYGMVCT